MRMTSAVLLLLAVAACSPDQNQPKSTVIDPLIQAEQKAKQAEQALQAGQQREAQQIDQQTQ